MKNELFFNDYLGFKVNSRKTMLPENRTGSLLTGMIGAGEIPVYADCLSTGLPSRISMETMFREWAIRNKEEAVRIIAWLEAEGCRELYRKYYPFIDPGISPSECKQRTAEKYTDGSCRESIIYPFSHSIHSLYSCMKFMENHPDFAFTRNNLPSTVIAWDMSRLILLVRLCFDCGYLTERQAWEHIIEADRRAWKNYIGIQGFFMGCLSGCAFSNGRNEKFDNCLRTVEKWAWLYSNSIV